MNYKDLWIKAVEFFKNTSKTSWGKNELVAKMIELELEESRKD